MTTNIADIVTIDVATIVISVTIDATRSATNVTMTDAKIATEVTIAAKRSLPPHLMLPQQATEAPPLEELYGLATSVKGKDIRSGNVRG